MDIDRELTFSPIIALEHVMPFPPFPTEVLLDIFDLACTSPKTALTLCLISRRFNALVTPFLYRSISARGIKEMLKLIDHLEKNRHIPPMVRNLFLSQRDPKGYKGEEYRSYLHLREKDELVLLSHTSQRIIALLSPFLETLSHNIPGMSDEDHSTYIFAAPLPRLRELTLEGGPLQFLIPIPSLERLHIYAQPRYRLICNLDELCPRLTHLKLTDIDYLNGRFIEIGLKRIWGIEMDERDIARADIVAPLRLPSPLHCLILQRGAAKMSGSQERQLWESLARLGEIALAPMVLRVQEPTDRMLYWEQVYRDWLDRVGCGEGCWKLGGEYPARN